MFIDDAEFFQYIIFKICNLLFRYGWRSEIYFIKTKIETTRFTKKFKDLKLIFFKIASLFQEEIM